MENQVEKPGKGIHAIQSWEQIRKSQTEAPRVEDIQKIISKGGEDSLMLSRDEVLELVTDYFKSKIRTVTDEETGETMTIWKSPPTKSELAARLGISLATLARYNKGAYCGGRKYQGMTREACEPESFPIIQRALLIISDFYERQLALNKNNSGSIFWLLNSQNERWSNQQDVMLRKEDDLSTPTQSAGQIAERYKGYAELDESEETQL